jgi:hypothetical protein
MTHDGVVVGQDGESQEDVTEGIVASGGWLDAEISDSFPASDPLSHWAGPRQRESEADRSHRYFEHGRAGEGEPER